MQTTLLTASDVRDIVHRVGLDALMDETIARITEAFATFDPEKIAVPTRDGFQYDSPDMGLIEWMPCMRAGDSVHIKVVGYHPNNAERHDLPTILSTLSTYGVHDGHLRGVMDATFITALRTGAASAVASRILALPDSSRLGIIGCGAQSVTQLHALSRIFRIKEVCIYDTDAAAMKTFEKRVSCLELEDLEIFPGVPQEFLDEVDIVCTATSVGIGEGPVFENGNFRPHIHVNAIGSDFPGKIELPEELIRKSLVCPDFANQALKEGECQQLNPAMIGPDIHNLVKDQASYLNARERETVFDSTGWALEDLIVAEIITSLAAEAGCGTSVDMQCVSKDPKNPYEFVDTALTEEERLATDEMMRA